jgi:hypothetical protein
VTFAFEMALRLAKLQWHRPTIKELDPADWQPQLTAHMQELSQEGGQDLS